MSRISTIDTHTKYVWEDQGPCWIRPWLKLQCPHQCFYFLLSQVSLDMHGISRKMHNLLFVEPFTKAITNSSWNWCLNLLLHKQDSRSSIWYMHVHVWICMHITSSHAKLHTCILYMAVVYKQASMISCTKQETDC